MIRTATTAFLFMIFTLSFAQENMSKVAVVEKYAVGYNETNKIQFINDAFLYSEGWQHLPQPIFWQKNNGFASRFGIGECSWSS